jgi:hypothetical protein
MASAGIKSPEDPALTKVQRKLYNERKRRRRALGKAKTLLKELNSTGQHTVIPLKETCETRKRRSYNTQVREVIMQLLGLNVARHNVNDVVQAVLSLTPYTLSADIKRSTVHNIDHERDVVMKGYVAGEIISADNRDELVGQSDGTSYKGVNIMAEMVGTVKDGEQRIYALGLEQIANKTTATQLQSLDDTFAEHRRIAEAVPSICAKGDPKYLDKRYIRAMVGDHAGDLKTRKTMLDEARRPDMIMAIGRAVWMARSVQERAALVTVIVEEFKRTCTAIDQQAYPDLPVVEGTWAAQLPQVQDEILDRMRGEFKNRAWESLGKESFAKMQPSQRALWQRK